MALNLYTKKPFPEARTYMETFLGYTFTNENLLREALQAGGPVLTDGRLVPVRTCRANLMSSIRDCMQGLRETYADLYAIGIPGG